MTDKLLPLPVGGKSPLGSAVRFWHQYSFRSGLDRGALVVGIILAATGAWLGLSPSKVAAYVDGSGYHLAGRVMPAAGTGAYGGDVAIVIRQADGQLRAAGAGRIEGAAMQGFCVFVLGSDREQCIFVVGRTSFKSEDRLEGDHWTRTYDGGRQVEIQLLDAAHPVPVPVPVGWR